MHCPRCGQQQVSAETKFCSRCGFQMAIVSELLLHGGFLPQLAELNQKKSTLFTKKNGVMLSVFWFIFFTLFLTSMFGIAGGEEIVAVAGVIGVFGSLMLLIASLVFLKSTPKAPLYPVSDFLPPPPALYGNQVHATLQPQQSQPAASYMAPEGAWKTPDTGQFAVPGSVTDDTTKLLKKDE